MKEYLERLVQEVQETQLVHRLMNAKNICEKVAICETAKMTRNFQAFIDRYDELYLTLPNSEESILSADEFVCAAENVVAVTTILIISGIDDLDFFDEEGEDFFLNALMDVEGDEEEVAEEMVRYYNDQELTTSDSSLEELLNQFF